MSSELGRFKKMVNWVQELVWGKPAPKPKRARNKKGRYKADDPTTKDYNEAYIGGKAPTRKQLLGLKKKKTKRKTKGKK